MASQGKIGMTKPRFDNLLYDVEDGIATVTLNRPDRLNAMTGPMMQELLAALDATDTDDEVKAVIVTGAGRGFCAGADLSRTADTFDYAARDGGRGTINGVYPDGGGKLTLRIFDSLKTVIAAVNGPAVGIGVTMLLAMDIRIASDAARFGFVFARRGTLAGGGFLLVLAAHRRNFAGARLVLFGQGVCRRRSEGRRPGALRAPG